MDTTRTLPLDVPLKNKRNGLLFIGAIALAFAVAIFLSTPQIKSEDTLPITGIVIALYVILFLLARRVWSGVPISYKLTPEGIISYLDNGRTNRTSILIAWKNIKSIEMYESSRVYNIMLHLHETIELPEEGRLAMRMLIRVYKTQLARKKWPLRTKFYTKRQIEALIEQLSRCIKFYA